MRERTGIGCIVLRNHPDRPVLLLRRAFGEFEGRWCFVAGTVESGELPEAASRRELVEETGLRSADLEEVTVHTEPGLILHVFVARVAADVVVAMNREHTEAAWFSFDEAARALPRVAQRAVLDRVRAS